MARVRPHRYAKKFHTQENKKKYLSSFSIKESFGNADLENMSSLY
jgi:hypothetical protein